MTGDNIKNNKGYSLLEMIISVAIFSMVFVMITTIYFSLVDSQRSVVSTQNIQESMKFVFEVIGKEIRNAKKSENSCIGTLIADEASPNKVYNTASSGSILYFKNKDDECVIYSLNNGRFEISRDGGSSMPVTPNDIYLENLTFQIWDDDIGAFHARQPSVTFKVDVESSGNKVIHKQKTTMQTTITSRYYE